jgi:glycosyltransferase involved in cell wall biosynthesis
MSPSPRVALGMPAYYRPDTMARTLESLLSQTYKDFAVVITDDRPSPEVQAIVETYRALDDRIQYEANPSRLGMIENWRRAFERSRARWPDSEYFAWVSDHDILHPRWLEALVAALDAHPQVVLAYPGIMRIYNWASSPRCRSRCGTARSRARSATAASGRCFFPAGRRCTPGCRPTCSTRRCWRGISACAARGCPPAGGWRESATPWRTAGTPTSAT